MIYTFNPKSAKKIKYGSHPLKSLNPKSLLPLDNASLVVNQVIKAWLGMKLESCVFAYRCLRVYVHGCPYAVHTSEILRTKSWNCGVDGWKFAKAIHTSVCGRCNRSRFQNRQQYMHEISVQLNSSYRNGWRRMPCDCCCYTYVWRPTWLGLWGRQVKNNYCNSLIFSVKVGGTTIRDISLIINCTIWKHTSCSFFFLIPFLWRLASLKMQIEFKDNFCFVLFYFKTRTIQKHAAYQKRRPQNTTN
jgi:hypothetical protein